MYTNQKIAREIDTLPSCILDMMANECGVKMAKPNELMELQAIFMDEVMKTQCESANVLIAFKDYQKPIEKRWKEWLVFHALDV